MPDTQSTAPTGAPDRAGTSERFPEAAPFLAGDDRSNRERMIAGDWYVADDPENSRISAAARRALHLYEEAFNLGEPGAEEHLRAAIPHLGPGCTLRPPVRVDYGDRITVGEGTFANYGLVALDVAEIRIGAHCQIGPGVQLLTPVHPLEPTARRAGLESADPISIGDNVWLGGGVIVCPGVTIGEGCVVGAGAVVTRDLPPYSLAVGNPARVIRSLDDSTFAPRH
ncbi:sugar O-acetyltransferase [Actinomyces gaoshouyii]|uniref:sugar O-acetyltransferase n=1 Tax=Actinomyces gaoshouyii TaxID=1960083 RepID=UPI0009C05F43|nr:sugar O-acetyltransferase [Actinomyces gaoshouyii]ARD41324.1 maltose acetyltransferase [Actinomyces gaoshouyii]